MQQYELNNRDNLVAADNQQGRLEREPSTTTRTAPKKQRKHKDSDGYHSCVKLVNGREQIKWVRTVKNGNAHCSECNQWKPMEAFADVNGKPYSYCKGCQRLHKAMSRYNITLGEAKRFYESITCECCGSAFEKQAHKHIHHIGEQVIGVVCLHCNHLLRDESTEHLRRLECCIKFVKQRVKI